MNTPRSSTPPLPPLFQGPYSSLQENRRQLSSLVKPKIRKLKGMQTWVCTFRDGGYIGFGLTPTLAYRDWKAKAITQ